jgi:hypothetical protein
MIYLRKRTFNDQTRSEDHKASILITGMERDELQRLDWMIAESFGLDRRIVNDQGVYAYLSCTVEILNDGWM